MAGGCCGGAAAQAASVASPYNVKLPDGTTVTVKSKAEERVERDKAWVRMRKDARNGGYTVTR
jgi:hypothetical protein